MKSLKKIKSVPLKRSLNGGTSLKDEIRDLQKKALEILDYFDDFCRENQLRYFVIGGCCIGSIRHRGFIPWDDDIDIFMPRPDYEKLSLIWEKKGDHEKYCLCRTDGQNNYHDSGTLLKDNNTTFINRHSVNDDIHHGYMIDILPLDAYAPTRLKRLKQVMAASLYSLFNAQRLPDNQGKWVRYSAGLLLKAIPWKKMRYWLWKNAEREMTKYDFDSSEYLSELVTGFKYMKNKYPKALFSQPLHVAFEDREIPIPVGYHQYLTMAFGDYMKLPPEDKQAPKHDTVFVDLDHSYLKYKGIWYCRDGK